MKNMIHQSVTRDGDTKYYHIVAYHVFFDGESKAMCTARPFPEKWAEGKGDGSLTACPTCVKALWESK